MGAQPLSAAGTGATVPRRGSAAALSRAAARSWCNELYVCKCSSLYQLPGRRLLRLWRRRRSDCGACISRTWGGAVATVASSVDPHPFAPQPPALPAAVLCCAVATAREPEEDQYYVRVCKPFQLGIPFGGSLRFRRVRYNPSTPRAQPEH